MSDSYIVRRSLFISFFERYCITALQFVSVMVLARILTPEDIGIYSVGLAFINIAHIFRDFGIGKYLIQEKDLTREKVASAWGLTFAFAWILGAVTVLTAPALADFYDTEEIEAVIYVVSISFFIIPIGAMAKDILKRSMSFGTLFKINVASTVANVVVGIGLALLGFSYLSMAWASVASIAVAGIMAQVYLPSKYRTLPSLKNIRPVLKFGGHVVGASAAQEVTTSVIDMAIGKTLGFATLGLYSRGQGYTKLYQKTIFRAANRVIHSQFAKVYRQNGDLASSFATTIDYMTLIGWFFLGFMSLTSLPLIRLLYGSQWDQAAEYASIICLSASIGIVTQQGRKIFDATGQVSTNFWLAVSFSVLKLGVVLMLLKQGLSVLLYGLLVVAVLNLLVSIFILRARGRINLIQTARVLIRNIGICAVSLLAPAYFFVTNENTPGFALDELLFSAAASVITWIVLIKAISHPLGDEVANVIDYLCEKFGWAKTP